jgi:ribonuclease HII
VAKVERDKIMDELHHKYPAYGFQTNRGYPTKTHLAALRAFGPCPEHRRSYAPVAGLLKLG